MPAKKLCQIQESRSHGAAAASAVKVLAIHDRWATVACPGAQGDEPSRAGPGLSV